MSFKRCSQSNEIEKQDNGQILKKHKERPSLHGLMQLISKAKMHSKEEPSKKYTLPPFLRDAAQTPGHLKSITKRTPSQLLGDLLDGIKTK